VHLVQFAHFDPGYTDLPSNVMDEYLGFLDDVVAWCERTADWPEEAKFRYVVEQAWIAWHYVNNRPAEMVERFARCCRAGQIEVTAFFANMVSDLLGAEETARLVYPAFALKRRYGIPIRTAEHNDVPAMAWSLATALVEAGIKYFMPGIPDYFTARYVGEKRAAPHRNFDDALVQPHDCPVAFWWEAQAGERVLVYLHRQGCGGGVDTNLVELAGVLETQAAEGYPYETFVYRLIGGHRDNSPPLFGYAETAKAWNARWAYPKLLMATDSMFFEAFEKELERASASGGGIPTFRRQPCGERHARRRRAVRDRRRGGGRARVSAQADRGGVRQRAQVRRARVGDQHASGLAGGRAYS
jgi:alpha-mannosidase